MATKKKVQVKQTVPAKKAAPIKKTAVVKEVAAKAKTAGTKVKKLDLTKVKPRKGYAEDKKWSDAQIAGYEGLNAEQMTQRVKDKARELALAEGQRAVDYRKHLADLQYHCYELARFGVKGPDELDDGAAAVSDTLDGSEFHEIVDTAAAALSTEEGQALRLALRQEEVRLAFMLTHP